MVGVRTQPSARPNHDPGPMRPIENPAAPVEIRMAVRRAAGEGTIRHRPDGRWEARVVVTETDGRRVRRSFLGRSRTQVRDKLHDALRAEETGRPTPTDRLTVGEFLQRWLVDSVRPSTRPSTYKSYAGIVHLHLEPGLGRLSLARLSPQQVQAFLNAESAAGLSPRSVAMERAVLRQALGRAERWGLVSRNVAKLAEPPRVPKHEIRPLTANQARIFLDAIRGDRHEALYLVALGVGLRQGEILGLSWPDLDLDLGTLTVRRALQRVDGHLVLVEPKSVTSRRVVALPALVHEALQTHRVRQLEERLRAGARWRTDPRDLVFVSTIGTPLDGIVVTRRFQSVLASASLPHQRFHDLPHACASLLLSQGIAARVVMEQLGHSQISLTLNTYTHVSPALGRVAADRMNDLLAG
jgi:integrase